MEAAHRQRSAAAGILQKEMSRSLLRDPERSRKPERSVFSEKLPALSWVLGVRNKGLMGEVLKETQILYWGLREVRFMRSCQDFSGR